MEAIRNVSLGQALAHLNNVDYVFVRLALSRGESVGAVTEFRSLVIEILPQVWLANHDTTLLAPWLNDQRVFECSTAFFFCGLVKSSEVQEWFQRPTDCGLTGFDARPEYSTRRISFLLPEVHENVSEWHLRSYAPNGATTIPFPSTLYTLSPKQERRGQYHDDEWLVGEDGDSFPSFRAARAELFYGITNRRDPSYPREDIFAIRVVDARGWLQEVRVTPENLTVIANGSEVLLGCYVLAQGAGVKAKALVRDHHVSLPLPARIEDEVEVVLLRGGKVLDEVVFYAADHPYPAFAHFPQLIVEREDIYGYVTPTKAATPTSAQAAVAVPDDGSQPHPKVFVSYSHDSPRHRQQVRDLADSLIRDGIDCVLDRYEVNPRKGWQKWMENQIEWADYVLVVCTETYCRRFNGREEPGKGLGAAWEGMIITQALYEDAGENDKFIPVVFSHGDVDHVPTPLKQTTRYMVADEMEYEKLYARLTQQEFEMKPPLGVIRPVKRALE